MKHAIRARHALLTSLGLLPLACGVAADTAPGGRAADLEEANQTASHGGPGDAGSVVTPPGTQLAACGASTPVFSPDLTTSTDGASQQLSAVATGFLRCASGVMHRPEPVTCQSRLPRPLPPASGADAGVAAITQVEFLYSGAGRDYSEFATCSADAECDARPFGYCAPSYLGEPIGWEPQCNYGCVVDADCGAGFVCQCGDPVGECVPASCLGDDECGEGKLCAAWFTENVCGTRHSFACQTADDDCATNADCEEGGTCVVRDGSRYCQPRSGVVCGRPFLVQDTARMADLVPGGDWARGDLRGIELDNPHEQLRVTEYWARAGLMEHASIAAFARFALQLLHLGAPRELLEASQRAMQDETEHARLCFGLAERYLGATVGAGPLPMDGALLDLDFARILVLCFREGCVGETVAALEARVARDHATDPLVQHALDRIAPDEQSHAELAWKFVRWALRENPTLTRTLLGQELELLANELNELAPASSAERGIPEHGVLAENERANIRRAALREIVLPCAEAVLRAESSSTLPAPTTKLSAWPA